MCNRDIRTLDVENDGVVLTGGDTGAGGAGQSRGGKRLGADRVKLAGRADRAAAAVFYGWVTGRCDRRLSAIPLREVRPLPISINTVWILPPKGGHEVVFEVFGAAL